MANGRDDFDVLGMGRTLPQASVGGWRYPGIIGDTIWPPPDDEFERDVANRRETLKRNLELAAARHAITVEQHIDRARAQIVELLAAARTAKDIVAIDVWTMAYDALNHTSVQIAQARQATKAVP